MTGPNYLREHSRDLFFKPLLPLKAGSHRGQLHGDFVLSNALISLSYRAFGTAVSRPTEMHYSRLCPSLWSACLLLQDSLDLNGILMPFGGGALVGLLCVSDVKLRFASVDVWSVSA